MPLQFNRKTTVEFGELGKNGLRVQNLRVSFNVKKTSTDTFNTGKVSIYNLNSVSRRFLDSFDIEKAKNLLKISAGYEETEKVVFVGNITLVSIAIEKPNVITTVEANDGEITINELKFYPPISYQAGTWAKHVIQDIAKKIALPKKPFDWSTVSDKQYKNGFVFQGAAKVLLNNLCNYLGVEWSIQDNHLKFNKIGGTDGAPILNLTPETGLLSSPVRLNDVRAALYGSLSPQEKADEKAVGASGKKFKKRLSGGYEIKCLLQPVAEPGGVVQVTAEGISKKRFRILEVEHNGDTHGTDWSSKLTTIAL